MTEAKRPPINWTNTLFLLGTPLVALVATPWYILSHGLGWPEAITFLILWASIAISVTAGYHRLFSHRTYQAKWPVRLFYLVFGAAAFENSVLSWCSDHRIHHSFVDQEEDPYNIKKGFWWAHMGWILFDVNEHDPKLVKDLIDDPLVRWQHRWYRLIAVSVAIGIPVTVGLLTNSLLGCIIVAIVFRIVVTHHVTFFINSLCHMIGFQPYSREHSGRDSTIMAALAFGEGYHNYHHTFPFDYRNGIRSWHFDPAKWAIYLLSLVGLTSNLKRASEAVILKAKVDVQFARAAEKSHSLMSNLRESYERHLHDAHARLHKAIDEFAKAQRERAERETAASPEKIGLTQNAVDQAWKEWKRTLRQMKRLAATASLS